MTQEEIAEHCHCYAINLAEIAAELEQLVERGIVELRDSFYFMGKDAFIIERRQEGSLRAEKYLKIARRVSKLISFFPFVKAVFISGSLSKGYVDKNGDIDFFIVTTTNRLWLCRTLLVLFKKVFLLNSRKYFCVNYFLSIDNLEIPDKNIFTATELIFVIPTYNLQLHAEFIHANQWYVQYYPNKNFTEHKHLAVSEPVVKRFLEMIFNGNLGKKLDEFCFQWTMKTWARKFKNFDPTSFDLNFRSRNNVSKHHPKGFQFKVIEEYQQKINEFETKFGIKLN